MHAISLARWVVFEAQSWLLRLLSTYLSIHPSNRATVSSSLRFRSSMISEPFGETGAVDKPKLVEQI